MTRGRKPKPILAKRLADNSRLGIEQGIPESPLPLTGIAKKEFARLASLLDSLGTCTKDLGYLLAIYATTWERYCTATADIKKNGTLVNSRANPSIKTAENAQVQLFKILQELGLTPLAKAKMLDGPVQPSAPADEEDDEWLAGGDAPQ